MAGGEDPEATPSSPEYKPLPSSSHDPNGAVLISHPSSTGRRRFIISIFLISFASILIYIFWPSDPRIKIERVKVSHVHVHRRPVPSIDMTMLVTLKVSNADVYSFDFTELDVAVDYRGKTLGHVSSDGGHVGAMGTSYLEAETELDGVTLFADVIHLIHDLAKGSIEFDTVTETNGELGVLFFRFPLKMFRIKVRAHGHMWSSKVHAPFPSYTGGQDWILRIKLLGIFVFFLFLHYGITIIHIK